ncbi:MAG: tetratricopeptide repeat protein [Elusimicrobia bacterium]|nr:tetratricopeptide repeat protein [Elusimicrobiota bacterium]
MSILSSCLAVLILAAGGGLCADTADTFSAWMDKAGKSERGGNQARALECYANALRFWKRGDGARAKSRALSGKASIHAKRGQWAMSIKDLTEAIGLVGQDKGLLYRRGMVYYSARKESQAIADFTEAVSVDPDFKEAYHERARAYESMGDAGHAKEDYGRACELKLEKACRQIRQASDPRAPAAKRPGKSRKVDITACIGFLQRCLDSGAGYSPCVERLEPCEKNPVASCCPQACRVLYHRVQDRDGLSEAEAFREVFRTDGDCLNPGGVPAESPGGLPAEPE